MEQVLTSVAGVSKTLEKVAASAGGSVERAQAGASSVKQAVEAIKEIAQSSEKIGGIVNVISDIADQTNLLALNASIEAARAGEHGRGFAVVADEVSKLADRSASSTKEIEALIKETLTQVQRGVALAEGSGASMEEIISGAMTASAMVTELQKSVELQQASIREIAAAGDQPQRDEQRDQPGHGGAERQFAAGEQGHRERERDHPAGGHLCRADGDIHRAACGNGAASPGPGLALPARIGGDRRSAGAIRRRPPSSRWRARKSSHREPVSPARRSTAPGSCLPEAPRRFLWPFSRS